VAESVGCFVEHPEQSAQWWPVFPLRLSALKYPKSGSYRVHLREFQWKLRTSQASAELANEQFLPAGIVSCSPPSSVRWLVLAV